MRQIFLDTETTGFNANVAQNPDRMVEIGCVELVNRKLTGNNLHFYLNPERDSEEGALRVHGLTTEFLSDKPKFEAIARELLDFVADAEIIIHNAPFDISFLDAELSRAGYQPFKSYIGSVIDTLVMAKEMFPGKRNSLDALCDRLEVDNSGRTLHGALLDAELLGDVYINMTRGQDALLMDVSSPQEGGIAVVQIDLRAFVLPVVAANARELAVHEDILTQIDKSSGGKTLWLKMV
jgi:DNA polymerase-3 subunit epsilon